MAQSRGKGGGYATGPECPSLEESGDDAGRGCHEGGLVVRTLVPRGLLIAAQDSESNALDVRRLGRELAAVLWGEIVVGGSVGESHMFVALAKRSVPLLAVVAFLVLLAPRRHRSKKNGSKLKRDYSSPRSAASRHRGPS